MESKIAFEGAVPVAFAFQAVQLVFDDSGEFLTTEQLPAGDAAARALPTNPPTGRAIRLSRNSRRFRARGAVRSRGD